MKDGCQGRGEYPRLRSPGVRDEPRSRLALIVILEGMKMGRVRVAIPKKATRKLELRKWKGRCKASFAELGYSSVDRFLGDVRGR